MSRTFVACLSGDCLDKMRSSVARARGVIAEGCCCRGLVLSFVARGSGEGAGRVGRAAGLEQDVLEDSGRLGCC